MPLHKSIVLTGGPCGGKSTALAKIAERLENLGYRVFCIPESATQLILAGAGPKNPLGVRRFQHSIIQLQKAWEDAIRQTAQAADEDCILLLDRGIWDGAAYIDPDQWGGILQENQVAAIERDTRYDAVIHLTTAADGAADAYTLENNQARHESPEEAIEADQRTITAWTGHPHLRIIDNSTGFTEKIQRAIAEITGFLGEPEPIETERKFLVAVDWKTIHLNNHALSTSMIVQHYLASHKGTELRVRRRGNNGQWAYTLTEKTELPDRPKSRKEIESRITADEYWDLLAANPTAKKVEKKRTCIVYRNTYFELDEIKRDGKPPLMILEVETEEDGDINAPNGIWIKDEVTGNRKYHNSSLAQ